MGIGPRWRTTVDMKGREHQAKENYSGALQFIVVCLIGLGLTWDPFTSSFFPMSIFWNGIVYPVPNPSVYYVAQKLFGFKDSWLERNLPQNESCLKSNS